jgi:hypothetical protein
MASKDDDLEKLLADAERAIQGRPPRESEPRDDAPARLGRVQTAAVAGAVAAAAVWVVFAVLPFLRAGSGAIGAFLATFAAVVVLGGRRR